MCFLFSVSFPFGLFFVSVLASKLLHLYTHFSTVPTGAFILYLPTFFLFDFVAVCIARLLFSQSKSYFAWAGCVIGSLATFIALGGASSQLGFYYETGGELEWRDATSYATSKEGLKVLLSGSWAVLVAGAIILAVSCLTHGIFYRIMGAFLDGIGDDITFIYQTLRNRTPWLRRGRYSALNNNDTDLESPESYLMDQDLRSSSDRADGNTTFLTDDLKKAPAARGKFLQMVSRIPAWAFKVAISVFVVVAIIARPAKPYDYMTITLPVSLLDVFKPEPDFCAEQRLLMENEWPLPDLLDKKTFKKPDGFYKGWAPNPDDEAAEAYRNRAVDWLPDSLPRGFFRWDPKRFKNGYLGSYGSKKEAASNKCPHIPERDPYYNPVTDPLRITNLDTDILPTLKQALGDGNVKIKHVVLILMESLREEFFPIQQDSAFHEMIMGFSEAKDRETYNERLSHLTPHIEQITGKSGGFKDAKGKPYKADKLKWLDQAKEGFGGINVQGGYTTATMSTKSFSANHCGTWPMPVEKFDEADTDAYQPCIPQILDLLNVVKENKSSDGTDFKEMQWRTGLFESMVEEYDRQEIFDEKLGFHEILTRKQLENDWRYNKSDELYHKVNYFAYPEPVLIPYLREFITNTTASNQRMWLSHFTSTTHHAWDTPKSWPRYDYMPHDGANKQHGNFNKYLNTIRYHDAWMAELMQMLDDTGISNETLVVFAGDHGHSFTEETPKQGTYENFHITNFRVPIVFRHPHLPRVQYEANATTVSVLPTVLDLLINSGSLNKKDTNIASDLVQDYEGQSLIRPYKTSDNGRRAWNFVVVNSGAGMLAVTSADVPWKLTMPMNKVFEYTLTNPSIDRLELSPLFAWSAEQLVVDARNTYGEEAAKWVEEAVPIAQWWSLERQRLWRHHSLQ
ncbi:hypothetical protein FZEAL_7524 [Fusarium zealandicum]|uniref:Sulfatase N-terminal domain-containing protein n=1 Tax=Fusarium zealandicum TaxID=1053134 RepID=A0A8H4UFZ0_9HYPO|nr:hypothetical protein FZEAL_7524 [Fusarium zealandicum]